MGGAGVGGTHPQFSQKTQQCLLGETQGPHPPNCRQCCQKLDDAPQDLELIKKTKNKTNKQNKIKKHQRIQKSKGKYQTAEMNFTLLFFRIYIFSSFTIVFQYFFFCFNCIPTNLPLFDLYFLFFLFRFYILFFILLLVQISLCTLPLSYSILPSSCSLLFLL